MPDHARVRVPATTANLGPGFDVLGMALSLHDEVDIRLDASVHDGPVVEYPADFDPSVPRDRRNYLAQGAVAVLEGSGIDPSSIVLRAQGTIPVSRGLGSSASALVAGAVAADALAGRRLGNDEILRALVGIEGHAEQLAAALHGGLVAVVTDEAAADDTARHLTIVELPVADAVRVVAAVPSIRLDTSDARRVLATEVPFADAVFNIAAATSLVTGLARGDAALIRAGTRDRLHQDARATLVPAAPDVTAAALEAGAAGACWSGAGPTILAVCTAGADTAAVGTAMTAAFAAHDIGCRTFVCRVETKGAAVLDA